MSARVLNQKTADHIPLKLCACAFCNGPLEAPLLTLSDFSRYLGSWRLRKFPEGKARFPSAQRANQGSDGAICDKVVPDIKSGVWRSLLLSTIPTV